MRTSFHCLLHILQTTANRAWRWLTPTHMSNNRAQQLY
jgi:hypothetical protein